MCVLLFSLSLNIQCTQSVVWQNPCGFSNEGNSKQEKLLCASENVFIVSNRSWDKLVTFAGCTFDSHQQLLCVYAFIMTLRTITDLVAFNNVWQWDFIWVLWIAGSQSSLSCRSNFSTQCQGTKKWRTLETPWISKPKKATSVRCTDKERDAILLGYKWSAALGQSGKGSHCHRGLS